jgi:hypothetical protein
VSRGERNGSYGRTPGLLDRVRKDIILNYMASIPATFSEVNHTLQHYVAKVCPAPVVYVVCQSTSRDVPCTISSDGSRG